MCYSAMAVANFFIERALATGAKLTDMHLQKMLFFAHAAFFKVNKKPLFSDPVVAWQHGPVIEGLYHRLKHYGGHPITDTISKLQPFSEAQLMPCKVVTPVVRPEDCEILSYLSEFWQRLDGIETWRLRALSHAEGGAWYKTVESQGINPADDEEVRLKLPRNLTILDSVIQECGR